MKIERFDIAPKPDGSWVNLSFSTAAPCTPQLLSEIACRLARFIDYPPMFTADAEAHWDDAASGIVAEPYSPPAENNVLQAVRESGTDLSRGDAEAVTDLSKAVYDPVARRRVNPIAAEPTPTPEVKPVTRRTRTPAPVAVEPAAETAPVTRRTRTPAAASEPVISDLDLAKAASETAAIVGVDAVKGIIAEMGVTTVNQIEGFKKREHFLGLLKAERGIVEDANAAA